MSSAELWDVSLDEYHADGANSVSHSELDCFIDDPLLYRDRYILGTEQRETSEALDFGAAFHAALCGESYVVIPDEVLTANGQRRGKAWDEFVADHEGLMLVTYRDAIAIHRMLANINACPRASAILNDEGQVEQSIRWTDPDTGLVLRCRMDKITTFCAADWKSCAVNPLRMDALAGHLHKYGYHRQAAFYLDGLQALTDDDFPFVFVFCRKSPSYACRVVTLEPDWIKRGREQNRAALRRLAECMATGHWQSPTHGTVVELSMPGWARFESQWEFAED